MPGPRYPVVFLHGFGSYALYKIGGFRPVVDHLAQAGVRTFAPLAPPYHTIEKRAHVWGQRLDEILKETGAERANLIAFSSSGLDARFLASSLRRADRIASITTVSSPHRGTFLADYFASLGRLGRKTLCAGMDRAGNKLYPDTDSQAEAAILDLTSSRVTQVFNPENPDHADVTYASYAAQSGKGTPHRMWGKMRLHHSVMNRGGDPNDGFVAVPSARWSGFRRVLAADHASLCGLWPGVSDFEVLSFYTSLVDDLMVSGH